MGSRHARRTIRLTVHRGGQDDRRLPARGAGGIRRYRIPDLRREALHENIDAEVKADLETLELKLGEAVFRETPSLTRSLLFIKIISVVAPLLGLLGTVTGMIVTFQAITLFGTGDPKLMAGGISQALVTTVLGLTVAIPMVLLHTLVSGRSRRILHILQEQSAGIVARFSEKGKGL